MRNFYSKMKLNSITCSGTWGSGTEEVPETSSVGGDYSHQDKKKKNFQIPTSNSRI